MSSFLLAVTATVSFHGIAFAQRIAVRLEDVSGADGQALVLRVVDGHFNGPPLRPEAFTLTPPGVRVDPSRVGNSSAPEAHLCGCSETGSSCAAQGSPAARPDVVTLRPKNVAQVLSQGATATMAAGLLLS
jgi:hypothetical protein